MKGFIVTFLYLSSTIIIQNETGNIFWQCFYLFFILYAHIEVRDKKQRFMNLGLVPSFDHVKKRELITASFQPDIYLFFSSLQRVINHKSLSKRIYKQL